MKRSLPFVVALLGVIGFAQKTTFSQAISSYRISGIIVSAITGQPVPGVRLLLAPASGSQWEKVALADKDGRFSFVGLKAEKLQLYAERTGFPRQGFDQHDGGYFTAIVTGEGQDTEHLVFRLQPASVIQGLVSDEYGEPVREARVLLFRRGLENGISTTHFENEGHTDDRGLFRFGSLLPGNYLIAVSARPWFAVNRGLFLSDSDGAKRDAVAHGEDAFDVAFPLTYYPGTTDETDAGQIDLRIGQSLNADVPLRSTRAVTLRLEGNSMSNFHLSQKVFSTFDLQPPVIGTMSMFPGGHGMTGIPPGRYRVTLEMPSNEAPEKPMSSRSPRHRGGEATRILDLFTDTLLDPGTFSKEPTASITGLARAEGVTLRNALVQVRNQETRDSRVAAIDNNGKFTFEGVPAGKYEVSIGNSSDVYLASMAASGGKAHGRTLEIPDGTTVQLAMLLSKGIGEIKGMAVQESKGFAGAMIVLVPENPAARTALFRRDQSDSDGTFTLRNVVPGRYTLLAIQDGWEMDWMDPSTMAPLLRGGTPVEVDPDGKYDLTVRVQHRQLAMR